jgi:hypothetical protein
MINKELLKEGFQNPSEAVDYVLTNAIYKVNNALKSRVYEDGIDVMSKDWDNLLILDACRADFFAEVNTISGSMDTAISKASKSETFIEENFAGGEFHDTIYITSNPFANDLSDDVFYMTKLAVDRWDDDLNTVQPSEMVDLALEAHNQHPNKRLVVHFMQPHEPHLGETAKEIRKRVNLVGYNIFHAVDDVDPDYEGITSWTAAEQGLITDDELRQAYRETLQIVLNEIEDLVDELGGKTVITADHGEMLGERILSLKKCYGHPYGLKTKKLREVPWFETENGDRRKITADNPRETENLNDEEVEGRLQALGYK